MRLVFGRNAIGNLAAISYLTSKQPSILFEKGRFGGISDGVSQFSRINGNLANVAFFQMRFIDIDFVADFRNFRWQIAVIAIDKALHRSAEE